MTSPVISVTVQDPSAGSALGAPGFAVAVAAAAC
jgi:hypothetical protein